MPKSKHSGTENTGANQRSLHKKRSTGSYSMNKRSAKPGGVACHSGTSAPKSIKK